MSLLMFVVNEGDLYKNIIYIYICVYADTENEDTRSDTKCENFLTQWPLAHDIWILHTLGIAMSGAWYNGRLWSLNGMLSFIDSLQIKQSNAFRYL